MQHHLTAHMMSQSSSNHGLRNFLISSNSIIGGLHENADSENSERCGYLRCRRYYHHGLEYIGSKFHSQEVLVAGAVEPGGVGPIQTVGVVGE